MKKILMLGAMFLALHCSDARAAVAVGEPAAALIVQELNGATFDLSKERGKVVLVHFWATWCLPCREQMPEFDAIYRKYHAHGLDIIAVSMDKPKHSDDVEKFMQPFAFPAAMGSDATTNDFGDPDTLPVTYVIDADGTVHSTFTTAEESKKSIAELVEPLLKKK